MIKVENNKNTLSPSPSPLPLLSDLHLFESKVKLILHILHILAIIYFHGPVKINRIQSKKYRLLQVIGFNSLTYSGISI